MSNAAYRVVNFDIYLHDQIAGADDWQDLEYVVPESLVKHKCDEIPGFMCRRANKGWEPIGIVWFERGPDGMPTGIPRPADDPSEEPAALLMESTMDMLGLEYERGQFDDPASLWSALRDVVSSESLDIYPEMICSGYMADMVSAVYDEVSYRRSRSRTFR